MVSARGLEPPTPGLRDRYSTKLSYALLKLMNFHIGARHARNFEQEFEVVTRILPMTLQSSCGICLLPLLALVIQVQVVWNDQEPNDILSEIAELDDGYRSHCLVALCR